jgi:Delta carbonic anhydrase
MQPVKCGHACSILALGLLSANSFAGDAVPSAAHAAPTSGPACVGFGPQAPRDIDRGVGENRSVFSVAPGYQKMNLCNIHFHSPAEHKAKDFSVFVSDRKHGHGGGFQCNLSKSLSQSELKAPPENYCKGLKPGDTIEVHWVYSSCDVKPGKGLGSCLSEQCSNPNLRVEAQVFTVVNDPKALNFMDYAYRGNIINGYHQAKALPHDTGTPVQYLGSTTGPKYSESTCSPLEATWSVRPQCAKVDINSISKWCKDNVFEEDHAHGIRKLVVNPQLLAPF